jgi:ribosomal protein S11
MLDFLLKPTNIINLEKSKYRKLQNILSLLQTKICFLKVRSTLNNIYVTATNNLGKVIFVSSGGTSKIPSSKRNTNYNLELILNTMLKKLINLSFKNLVLNLDLFSLRKKKIIVKSLQKSQIKILGIHLNSNKAFNGVRPCKRRRI